jgi:hypothetical protein
MSIHVHIRVLPLHLLHHLHLLILLELCQLVLGAVKPISNTSCEPNQKNVQAWRVVLQHSFLKVRWNHAVPAHVQRPHLGGHHRLLSHELVILLFSKTHHILRGQS